jgi:hypothetical protein
MILHTSSTASVTEIYAVDMLAMKYYHDMARSQVLATAKEEDCLLGSAPLHLVGIYKCFRYYYFFHHQG